MLTESFVFFPGPEIPEDFMALVRAADEVSVDFEADGLHHYYSKMCLVQMNVEGGIYVADPLGNSNMADLFGCMRGKTMVIHSASYDLKLMKDGFGFVPDRIFDTMVAIQLLGYEKWSLADLVLRHFGVVLAKGPQKMDWSVRPLSDKMLDYSANDVKYLPELHRRLALELEEKGRTAWMEESCEHVIRASLLPHEVDPEEVWRIKGSFALGRCEMAYLRDLWKWREAEAMESDVPSFKILQNERLVELASWCAAERKPVFEWPLYSRMIKRWKRGERCEKARLAVMALPPKSWPAKTRPRVIPHMEVDPDVLDRIKAGRDEVAARLEISPPLIANQKTLSKIASMKRITDPDVLVRECGLMRWQRDLLKDVVMEELGA